MTNYSGRFATTGRRTSESLTEIQNTTLLHKATCRRIQCRQGLYPPARRDDGRPQRFAKGKHNDADGCVAARTSYSDPSASHRRHRVQTQDQEEKNHNCVSQGCTDTRTPGMGQEDVHIPFDCGCATHTTPAFVAFLYDLALRVVVMIPSVSQNLETTKQRGQSWEEM